MRSLAFISTLFLIGVSAVFPGCAKEKASEPGTTFKVVNLGDTLISIGYTGEVNYSIDLDGNKVPDFTFSLWGQVNGYGSWRGITLKSADSTGFPGEVVTDVNGIDTNNVNIVRIFNLADTIHSQDCLEQDLPMTRFSDGKYPPTVYISVDNWVLGVYYIGFK